jgi:peptidoglycan/xylan/chitin deacetylase (PgdA/CDA1 family)
LHSLSVQKHEIRGSRDYLEKVLDRAITSFSYPFGDYAAETVSLVEDAGFSCACSTGASAVFSSSDRFQLGRFEVPDCDGETFERQLFRWFRSRSMSGPSDANPND